MTVQVGAGEGASIPDAEYTAAGAVMTDDVAGLWADSELGSDSRTVDAHIRRLRKKLSILPDLISTVRGEGYRFNSTPSVRVRVTRPVALAA